MSTVINGRELADQMQAEIQKDVEKMTQQGIQPGLVVLLVGENPASQTYVRNKERSSQNWHSVKGRKTTRNYFRRRIIG